MRGPRFIAAAAAFVALMTSTTQASGAVSSYNISDPTYGACRLKGISESSDNFKYYASVSGEDETLNDACARCIEVTRDDDSTVSTTAYVLDVCDGCAAGTLQLSGDALDELNVDTTAESVDVSYTFVTCPSNLLSGDIEACLMEGASATYVPLQFYNSQKVIVSATIDGVDATSTSSSFLFSANSGSNSSTWYESVDVSVTSEDGETKNTTFSFTSTSGCATSDVQFNSASTSDGVDSSTAGTSAAGSSTSAIIGGVVGGVGALLIIVGSVILIRRRNRASKENDPTDPDVENQYLSPKNKPSPAAPTHQSEHSSSGHGSGGVQDGPASPVANYAESYSPAASSKKPSSALSDSSSAGAAGNVVASPAVPASIVAAGINIDSPASSNHSSPTSPLSPPRRTLTVEPTFAYSTPSSTYSNGSGKAKAAPAPTFAAPVVPRQTSNTFQSQYEDEDQDQDRSSFDVDDMRESARDGPKYAAYSAADPYASTVTSPQSYVRATSLRRPSAKRNSRATSGRESGRYANNSVLSNADSYMSTAPRNTNNSMMSSTGAPVPAAAATDGYSFSQTRPSESAFTDNDSYAATAAPMEDMSSQRSMGSLRESGGYSRDSLNILGYPYSKKSGRHHNPNINSSEMQL